MADTEGSPGLRRDRGKTVHGEAANAGHRVLAPDDAEVEAYLETALNAPAPARSPDDRPAGPGGPSTAPGPVVVLDFGSQFAQLIARRVRELDVYSELLPHDTPFEEIERRGTRAIILSGGPMSVYDDGAPRSPTRPSGAAGSRCSGICYGAQLMARELGGDVVPAGKREYGPANVTITTDDALFAGIDREQPVWMSHGDSITRLPGGLPRHRPDRLDALRRPGRRRRATCTASSSIPRSSIRRAAGTSCATSSSASPAIAPTWTAANFIESTVAGIRDRVDAHAARDRLGRQGHLRPVGRRRFGRRGGARPSGGRRSADLHLRRPRPDAQEGVGAAARDIRARPWA